MKETHIIDHCSRRAQPRRRVLRRLRRRPAHPRARRHVAAVAVPQELCWTTTRRDLGKISMTISALPLKTYRGK